MKNRAHQRPKASKRKGSLEETISYATHRDDPRKYLVSYRDKDLIKETDLEEFMNSDYFSPIPLTRIVRLTKDGRVIWTKGQKDIVVKGEKNDISGPRVNLAE